MPTVGWVDTEDVAEEWLDAPEGDELTDLLETAFEVCAAYAPRRIPAPLPKRYKKAQLLQAQHIYARGRAGNNDTSGPEGYGTSTYLLVMEARNLLRPPTRCGGIF